MDKPTVVLFAAHLDAGQDYGLELLPDTVVIRLPRSSKNLLLNAVAIVEDGQSEVMNGICVEPALVAFKMGLEEKL